MKKKESKPQKQPQESYHHGDLRNMLLLRSEAILEEKGVQGLSLRDVASDLGVSHSAPYRHFPNKLDLLFALATRGFSDLRDAMNKAWEENESAIEKLNAAGSAYIHLVLRHPRRTELMFGGEVNCGEAPPEELLQVGKEAYMGLYRIVEFGRMGKVFRNDLPTESLAMSVWSAVHGFAVINERDWRLTKTEEERETMKKQMSSLFEILVHGIRDQSVK
ncbi:TetR/AcrR family transcriptional regulator [Leptospira sp. 'Mane']|uniref:TetR/AcrR family transcriptional regulator n=1 Tax=Leptospira sp. 'Mane' TaxID=3387407 RepID=UPI00398A9D2A